MIFRRVDFLLQREKIGLLLLTVESTLSPQVLLLQDELTVLLILHMIFRRVDFLLQREKIGLLHNPTFLHVLTFLGLLGDLLAQRLNLALHWPRVVVLLLGPLFVELTVQTVD